MQASVPSSAPEVMDRSAKLSFTTSRARCGKLASGRIKIYEAACADISKNGMGTTLTCLMPLRSHVIVGQVGDSRAYLWRKGA